MKTAILLVCVVAFGCGAEPGEEDTVENDEPCLKYYSTAEVCSQCTGYDLCTDYDVCTPCPEEDRQDSGCFVAGVLVRCRLECPVATPPECV